jgi:hypothetical protein
MSLAQHADVACTKCKFFDNHANKPQAEDGLCRYNRPVVSSDDWCGHFSNDVSGGTAD